VLAIALVIPFDYRSLIGMSNVAVAVQYLATCLAVLVIRKTQTGAEPDGFRIPGGPLVPVLGALVSLSIFTQASVQELSWAAASLVVGLGALAVFRRK